MPPATRPRPAAVIASITGYSHPVDVVWCPGGELVVAVLTNLLGAGPTELARGVAKFFP